MGLLQTRFVLLRRIVAQDASAQHTFAFAAAADDNPAAIVSSVPPTPRTGWPSSFLLRSVP
ncbi:hypothetical protein, partial [Mesorhizobium sp. M8A.F.Ca.ET.142.01.1.1]|uniref:hypothetical protein n=1 Tax=Mesorhizobium sp. M8A.F.Ca.ET.142.01.1.1 TaxID=2563958 RepID=UPI001AEF0FDC